MFTVQNISRELTPYVSGVIRSKRSINKMDPVTQTPAASDPHRFPAESESVTDSPFKNYEQSGKENSPRRKVVLARELMTSPVVTVSPSISLSAAWRTVVEKRFRHLPVVDEHGLVGLISDRDILREFALWDREKVANEMISKIMHTDLLTATPDTEIRDIARVLIEERIGCMLIVNTEKVFEGIITRSDILRALIATAPLDLWG